MRLLLQCLNAFFFVHLLFSVAVLILAPMGLWCGQRIRPRLGVWLLLGLRLFPVLAAVYASLAIVLPSYLRLEPATESERVGLGCICFAALAVGLWLRPVARTIKAVWRSSRFLNRLQSATQSSKIRSKEICIFKEGAPRVVVAGLLRPRVLLSESAVKILSPEELEVVLLHEQAHQRSRDNMKRLLLLLLPDSLPFFSFMTALERACKRLAEWAADDYATAGDSLKSIVLAKALVRFARYQTPSSDWTLATSLVDNAADLAIRVERLLGRRNASAPNPHTYVASVGLACATLATLAAVVRFASLPDVHRLLEILSH
jgi:beta-lactamase regulating signal transducer with metallopeptidase domain